MLVFPEQSMSHVEAWRRDFDCLIGLASKLERREGRKIESRGIAATIVSIPISPKYSNPFLLSVVMV